MSARIIYLHGLGSSGQSSTAIQLADAGLNISAPDYAPHNYQQSISQLKELIEQEAPQLIAGTSMGGYYALKMAELTGLPCIAINACYQPDVSLRKYLQTPAEDFANGGQINITQNMLSAFRPLSAAVQPSSIIIGLQDDSIPPAYQRTFCRQMNWQWLEKDWGHRVGDAKWLAEHIKEVLDKES